MGGGQLGLDRPGEGNKGNGLNGRASPKGSGGISGRAHKKRGEFCPREKEDNAAAPEGRSGSRRGQGQL